MIYEDALIMMYGGQHSRQSINSASYNDLKLLNPTYQQQQQQHVTFVRLRDPKNNQEKYF